MKLLKKYDKYLKGKLSEEEMDTFTTEVVREHFEEELKVKWKKILDKDEELMALKNSTMPKKESGGWVRKIGIKRILSFAAAILLLVAAGLFVFQPSPNESYAQLIEQHLEKPFPSSDSRVAIPQNNELQQSANNFYRQKNYTEAIPVFEKLIDSPESNSTNLFYLGLSYLYTQNYEQAIKFLRQFDTPANSNLSKETTWFLSLAYIQAKQLDNAQIQLQKLIDLKGWKSKEAQVLLEKIKR